MSAAYPNAYEGLALEDLPLKELLPKKVHRRLLSKQLITSTTLFTVAADDAGKDASGAAAAEEGANATMKAKSSSSYVVRKKIKSPQALLRDVDDHTTKGIAMADALASLFPPTPYVPAEEGGEGGHVDPAVRGELSESEEDTGEEHANNHTTAMGHHDSFVAVARADHAEVLDVVCLQERIIQLCAEGKAKAQGVCSVREAVYDRGMQELIRQVTVHCPERGLLLAELTDEIKESTGTYDLLFDSACQYAVRKAIERDLYRTMLRELDELRVRSRTIENRVQELRAKKEGLERRFAEQRETERKLHEEEVAFLKRGNAQLSAEIKRLTA